MIIPLEVIISFFLIFKKTATNLIKSVKDFFWDCKKGIGSVVKGAEFEINSFIEIVREMISAGEEFEDIWNFEEQSDLHNNLKNSKDTYILGKIKLENQKKEEEEKYKSLTEEFNSTKLEFKNKDFKKIFSEFEKDFQLNLL